MLARFPLKMKFIVGHRIADALSGFEPVHRIPPSDLEDYFDAHKDWDKLSLDDFKNSNSKEIRDRSLVMTFDDGYEDNIINGLPVFESYNVPVTIFVTLSLVDGDVPIEHDIAAVVNDLDHCMAPGKPEPLRCQSSTEKALCFRSLKTVFRRASPDLVPILRREFLAINGDHPGHQRVGMTWDQLSDLDKHPLVTIGAHAVSHTRLTGISQISLRQQLCESKALLESRLGHPVRYFSYPYGKHNRFVRKTTKEAGYSMAVGTNRNLIGCLLDPLYSIPRIDLKDDYERTCIIMQKSC